ncbi:MAG: DUF2339 domain-containing protein [Bacteroidota bacterium]
MEIFLLVIILGLIVIFYFQTKDRLEKIEQKLFDIHNQKSHEATPPKEILKQKEKEVAAPINIFETHIEPDLAVNNAAIVETKEEILEKPQTFVAEINKYITESVKPIEEKIEAEQKPINMFSQVKEEPVKEEEKSWFAGMVENNDLEKFIGENLISKIGIAILVLGIAFFVKYAIDQNWINEIARVGIGILAGGIILGFAHKLRENFKAFSTVLVAGGISTFYFTIGLAFQEYHLFSQTVAFAIMLVITAFSVFISIGYNRQELAILSIIGGFATPFIVSTGSGNYIVLFSYVLILDLGMLVLAFVRKWTLVNIITYILSLILYIAWLTTKGLPNHPEYFSSAFIFATLFYFVFVAMNIAYNIKHKQYFKSIDFGILLSNTFAYYGIGIALFSAYNPQLKGAFTLGLALSNCLLAWFIVKNSKADKNLLYVLIGLALTFITLAAPIQLKGNYITLFWAAEGALLLWLSQKSGMNIFRVTSAITYVLAMLSLIIDWNQQYALQSTLPIIINKGFIAGTFVCVSLWVNTILLKKDKELVLDFYGVIYEAAIYLKVSRFLLVVLVYIAGLLEVSYQLNTRLSPPEAAYFLTGMYHFLFTSILIFFINKQISHAFANTIKTIGIINLIIYVCYFNSLPFKELEYNFSWEYINDVLTFNKASHLAFAFHYVSLACIFYQAFITYGLFKQDIETKKMSNKILYWSSVIVITFLASSEVILHVVKMKMVPVMPTAKDVTDSAFYVNFDIYNDLIKQTSKVFLPVLWGVLSFLFLWFGIKNQIKHLRIAALYLLGLTLIKLFVYDIRDVSEGGKILAFILLGIVLLVISFMYQKIKAIIINDEPQKITNEENL